MSGEHGDGRARSALLPAMYSPAAIDLFGQVKACFDPENAAQPRRPGRPAAGGQRSADHRPGGQGRPLRRGGAPLHRCRQVPGRQHPRAGRDVPVVPGHPEREGLDPRPRPGAAGDDQRRRDPAGLEVPGGAPGARPVPVLQGLRPGLPDRDRHGGVQGPGPGPDLCRPDPAAQPLRPRLAAPLGAADHPESGVGQPGQLLHRYARAALADPVERRGRPTPVDAAVCRSVGAIPGRVADESGPAGDHLGGLVLRLLHRGRRRRGGRGLVARPVMPRSSWTGRPAAA